MLISFIDESGSTCTGHFVSREDVSGRTDHRYLVVLERPEGGRFRTYVKPDVFRAAMTAAQLNLDPKPWVAWGVRYATQMGSAYFEPGPGYAQDRTLYDTKEA